MSHQTNDRDGRKDLVDVFIQARMSSTRLPGKVLIELEGKTVLEHIYARLSHCRTARHIVVLTSSDVNDDPIAELCQKNNMSCFRGPLEDVLARFYRAARNFDSRHIVRITGDCPCIDPFLVDAVVDHYFVHRFHYSSNGVRPTYPDGLDVEVFQFECLENMYKNASLPYHREHVTQYVYSHMNQFSVGSFESPTDYSFLRICLDTEQDLAVIRRVYSELYSAEKLFTFRDILELYDRLPDVFSLNSHIKRNSAMLEQKKLQENSEGEVDVIE